MSKNIKALITIFLMSVFCLIPVLSQAEAVTDADGYVLISTPDELASISENPSGLYRLARDIDMAGYDWKPFAFSGTFDGNGYSILNLTVTSLTADTRVTYDGNWKTYDTYLAGLFGAVENATISNVSLLGEKIDITTDQPCFVGGIAGFSEKSNISGCVIQGDLRLNTSGKCFGVAGVAGFGNGQTSQCNVDVVLVCNDTDTVNKDEQFMGGIVSDGYMDVVDCNINIKGYVSEHGYCHNGGIIGMYIFYPTYGLEYNGHVDRNTVNGFISFFEDNEDRRAYCKAEIGEIVNWDLTMDYNETNFNRDEIWDYDVVLLPEKCDTPNVSDEVTAATETAFGFTTHTCQTCGNVYKDSYVYKVGTEPVVVEPETDEEIKDDKSEGSKDESKPVNDKKADSKDKDTTSKTKTEHKGLIAFIVIIGIVLSLGIIGAAYYFIMKVINS